MGIGTANPVRRYSQREIYDISAQYFPMYRNPRIEQIFMGSDIDYRHFSFDKETFVPNESADELHSRFAEHSVRLAAESIRQCLDDAGASTADVDYIIAVSCTGYLCPGLSAILIRDLGLRTNLQRADLIGMGCAGAMPGLQRAFDYVKAYPDRRALLVAVEICSACYYVDESLETVVGNAICGDGSAAVLVGNHNVGKGPELVAFETLLEPSLLHTVGFQFREGKLRIVLSKDIRDAAGGLAAKLVKALLGNSDIRGEEIDHWVIHSGGRKVIDNIKAELGLSEEQLQSSRAVLRNFGNMSSPTILFVLADTMHRAAPAAGDIGVMLALGPGLAAEGAVVIW
jgi:alkylresorcinol/alkylpyrone synthase/polyketide synthase Type III